MGFLTPELEDEFLSGKQLNYINGSQAFKQYLELASQTYGPSVLSLDIRGYFSTNTVVYWESPDNDGTTQKLHVFTGSFQYSSKGKLLGGNVDKVYLGYYGYYKSNGPEYARISSIRVLDISQKLNASQILYFDVSSPGYPEKAFYPRSDNSGGSLSNIDASRNILSREVFSGYNEYIRAMVKAGIPSALQDPDLGIMNDTIKNEAWHRLGLSKSQNYGILDPGSGILDLNNPKVYTVTSIVANNLVTTVNEGSIVVFQISATNVPTGTAVNYKVSGDVNAVDFVAGTSLTGTGKIDSNGMLNISFQIANDKKTEGHEQLKFQLFNSNNAQLGDTVSLTVNDTSKAPPPTFVITPSKSVLNEGDTLTTTITTSNITPGTLYWKVSGLVTANDFSSGSLSGSLKVRDGGSYKLTHILKNDYLTEDSENLTVSLFTDSAFQTVLTTSSTVTINDTSTDTLISSRTAILPSGQANLTLTGTGNINGTGNDMNNTIIGNTGNNNLTGRKGKDILTGLDGQDTFSLSSLADSLLSAYDVITDFTIGEDKIKAPRSYSGKVIASPFNVSDTKPATIQSKLTASAFKANTAAILNSGQQTFLALNDATAGFDPLKDSFIEITGYKSVGNLTIANIGSSIL